MIKTILSRVNVAMHQTNDDSVHWRLDESLGLNALDSHVNL